MRASHAQVQTYEVATEVRFSSGQRPQSLRQRSSPHRKTDLQRKPLGRPGLVAKPYGLIENGGMHQSAKWRRVSVRLTAPI